ncbi:hypothetical protein ANCCAN_25316 [Ancylostoma caninum]|uniref:Uncharacterized protein n=1 Tax=Ancylostoma caninum TaxID=29170 RepID=A0A368F9Z5_ANCCA|nr:hypothetical protein ANCCAN_25316 [Ancylostoma caninum]
MQIASGVITGAAAMPSCAAAGLGSGVSSPVCCSYDAATPSSFTAPRPAMEKQQRSSAAATATEYVRAAAADHVLEYSASSSPSLSPSNALQVAHDQLRKIYIAEASLLRNMEECSSSSDLDYLVEALQQLRNFESDVQRRLFSHVS